MQIAREQCSQTRLQPPVGEHVLGTAFVQVSFSKILQRHLWFTTSSNSRASYTYTRMKEEAEAAVETVSWRYAGRALTRVT
jgi:hypothetical protein